LFHWEKRRAAQSPAPCHYSLWAEVDGQRRIQADLYPDAGFKSTGLFWNGEWYGPAEPDWADALQANPFLGAPILFPTPNRVRQHAFTFADRRYEMIKNGSPRAQHGIAFDSAWAHGDPVVEPDAVSLTATLEIRPGDANYAAFPFPCRLTVCYRLTAHALQFGYRAENLGGTDLPYGIGLHPCFSLRDAQEPVHVMIPARAVYEVTPDLLPTGALLTLEKDKNWQVDRGRDLREFCLDNGFLLQSGEDTLLRYPARSTQLRICTTPEFTVSVLYTPVALGHLPAAPHPLFFLEHQTCCTDAINLHEAGVPDTGLLILPPGAAHEGGIDYIFEELKQ